MRSRKEFAPGYAERRIRERHGAIPYILLRMAGVYPGDTSRGQER